MRSTWIAPAVLATALALILPTGSAAAVPELPRQARPAAARPAFTVETVVSGLDIPWDFTWVGQLMLFDERPGRLWSKRDGQAPQRVSLELPPLLVNSEGGLLGIVADPRASQNGFFYTCQSVATASGSAKDIEVWKWRLTSDTTAAKVGVLVKGLPVGYGRHNGCRLVFRSEKMRTAGRILNFLLTFRWLLVLMEVAVESVWRPNHAHMPVEPLDEGGEEESEDDGS